MQVLYPPRIVITGKLNVIFPYFSVSNHGKQQQTLLTSRRTAATSPSGFIENVWHWLDAHIQQQVSQLRTLDHARAILPGHLDAPKMASAAPSTFIEMSKTDKT